MSPMKKIAFTDQEVLVMFNQKNNRNFAFEIIMNKFRSKVLQTISKIVKDADDAEDLTQDAFIKVWQNLEYFRGDSQLSTWIHRIATNEGLNFLRNKKKMTLVDIEESSNSVNHSIFQYLTVTPEEIEKRLYSAMETLPKKQLSVFKMRYFDEMSYEQMATNTGTSIGALKASYHIGMKKVEDFLSVA